MERSHSRSAISIGQWILVVQCILTLWTRLVSMWTNSWVRQKSEWSASRPKEVLSGKVHLPDYGLVCMWTTTYMGLFTLQSPQVTLLTVFICYIASMVLIQPKITRKIIHNGGNQARRQNKQEIIYLMNIYRAVLEYREFELLNKVR